MIGLFPSIAPEQAGVSAKSLRSYLKFLQRGGVNMHSLLLMRGDNILAEYYWAPFTKDFCHRMYSQTKSYVAIAVGLLEEDGRALTSDLEHNAVRRPLAALCMTGRRGRPPIRSARVLPLPASL
jgi:hypothetical protein